MGRDLKAIILGAIASLLWSTVFVAGRYLCDVLAVHPILVAFLRFASAGIVLILYTICKGEVKSLSVLINRPGLVTLLALTGIFGMGSAIFLALSRSTAVDVSIIMNSNPIFITPLAVFAGERITSKRVIGIIVGLIGCALVISGGTVSWQLVQKEHLLGNLIALVAALCWAVYTVAGKKLVRERGGLVVTSGNMIVGSIFLLFLVAGIRELTIPPPKAFLFIAYLAIFPTAIGFVLWYKALENIDASRLGPMQYLVPVGTAVISIFTLHESVKAGSIVGMLLVFFGIYLSTRHTGL